MFKKIQRKIYQVLIGGVALILLVSTLLVYLVSALLIHFRAIALPQSALFYLLFLFLAIVLVGSLIAALIAYRLSRPFRRLNRAIAALSKGQFALAAKELHASKEWQKAGENLDKAVADVKAFTKEGKEWLSHIIEDIQSPIETIESYVVKLKDSTLSAQERETYISLILRLLHQITSIIRRHRRAHPGEIRLKKEEFSLDGQLKEVLTKLSSSFAKKDIMQDTQLTSVTILADQKKLAGVWNTLYRQLISSTPKKGIITTRLTVDGGTIQIVLGNDGMQSPKVIHKALHQRGRRQRPRGKAANARQLIEAMGGSFRAKKDSKTLTYYIELK